MLDQLLSAGPGVIEIARVEEFLGLPGRERTARILRAPMGIMRTPTAASRVQTSAAVPSEGSMDRKTMLVSMPSSNNVPDVGTSRQPIIFMKVDLPDPLAPMMATNSPRFMVKETPLTACSTSPPIT